MAKVAIKSEKLSPFGGIFSIMEQFDSNLSSVIDSTLGMRCRLYGYQYSEIIRSLMSVYFCGGSCMVRLDVKRFGLKATSRIKAFVFKFISVPAKWVRTSRQYVLNIYSCNNAYADVFQNDFG